jgi:hypothetical protein
MIHYYLLKGDYRALDAAIGIGEYLLKHRDAWMDFCFQPGRPVCNHTWLTERWRCCTALPRMNAICAQSPKPWRVLAH